MLNKLKLLYLVLKRYRLISGSWFVIGYLITLLLFEISIDYKHFFVSIVYYLICFGLIYPIVYIYNDICDLQQDKLNKSRYKYKPLAQGIVDINQFMAIGVIALGIGLILMFFIEKIFILFIGIAVFYNYFYTKYLKHMFFVENIANGFTHTFVRMLLGICVAFIGYNINLDYRNLIIIALILSVHTVIMTLGALYKRYLEFKFGNKLCRSTLVLYSESIFKKSIVVLNILYVLLLAILNTYIQNTLINIAFVLGFVLLNLPLFYRKTKIIDKIVDNIILI